MWALRFTIVSALGLWLLLPSCVSSVGLGQEGDSCTQNNDCITGLLCINQRCGRDVETIDIEKTVNVERATGGEFVPGPESSLEPLTEAIAPDGGVEVPPESALPEESTVGPEPMPEPRPECSPTLETCNGRDDDCNGTVDEGELCDVTNTGRTCYQGTCVCPPGYQLCQGRCQDTLSTKSNCGSCGTTCSQGQVCVQGKCSAGCTNCGTTTCGSQCVDTSKHLKHCGGCNNACPVGSWCEKGACRCYDGWILCGNKCVANLSDPLHCGTCGNACGDGMSCQQGYCKPCGGVDVSQPCPFGKARCGCECVDLNVHRQHCGSCFRSCFVGSVCVAGTCNVGCPAGNTLCHQQCTDTQTNLIHCGSCFNSCPTNSVCVNGVCQCPPSQTLCDCSCFDLQTEVKHCGACSKACSSGQTCVQGMCQ